MLSVLDTRASGHTLPHMKTYILAAMVLAGITQLSLANLKIPRSVYQVEDMEEAMATATEKEKPLIFVFTDPGTT